MSDPMTNTEVEDVLASIRRLVSDEKRPDPVADAPGDRLVLTPSLRVMDDPATHEQEQVPDDEDATLILSDAERDVAVGDAAQDSTGPLEKVDVDASAPQDMPPGSIHDVFMADPADDRDNGVPIEGDSPETPESIEMDIPATPSLTDKIAALETLIGGQDGHYEPDHAGEDAYAGTEPPAMAWEDVEDMQDVPEADETHLSQVDPGPAHAAHVADVNEAMNHPEAQADDTPEPAAAPRDTPEPQLFAVDEDVLDEDALRELISDIVREELQGALGERITRNVRKLVRREIHRALAAQDLE